MSRKSQTIVLTGAGSGGHITPILAVAEALKKDSPSTKLIYIGQKGDALGDIPANHGSIDEVYAVRAGKFRRYHGEGLKQLLDVPTLAKNFRDGFYVVMGLLQSRRLLKKLNPDVVFVKGGFVGVPVGLASAWLKIPYVTHDSDTIPGLANRIIAKWATMHAVGMPVEMYSYPESRTIMTGIPLQKDFEAVTEAASETYKESIGVPKSSKMLLVIGGGLGSQRVNHGLTEIMASLMGQYPDLHVVHVVGRANEDNMKSVYVSKLSSVQMEHLQVYGYLSDVYRYSGAADLIITRAGATNLAEFAVQGKACIVIPSPFLTGGHQLKNAKQLSDRGAVSVLAESDLRADPNKLLNMISELLKDDQRRLGLASSFSDLAVRDSATKLASLLIDVINSKGKV